MPYIERTYLTEQFENLLHNDNIMNPVVKVLDALEIIDSAPSADVAEAKHGYWKWERKVEPMAQNRLYCSVCDKECLSKGIYYEKSEYCPHCGARMDGTPRKKNGR